MTVSREELNTTYSEWFRHCRNAERAKEEILKLFSKEPDSIHEWTEQDIYEQVLKIIKRYS